MLRTLILSVTLLAAACSPPASDQAAKSDMEDMNMTESMPPATVSGPVSGTGVVTQVDAAAGTVTFNHEPMAAVNWPAMTMQFTAEDPSILQGIAVGDRVNFQLKSATESEIVIRVERQ